MHGTLASAGRGGSLLCSPPPVQWAQGPVSACTYLDVSCHSVVSAAVLCLLVPLENGDQVALSSVSPPLWAQRRWPRKACPGPTA